jgi:predicted MFS family arabinose efflux permease
LVIPLLVLGMTKSPLAAGLVALSQQIGVILFSIPIGTWIENKNKFKVITFTKAITILCIFFLSFLVFQDQINGLIIAVVLFLMGILGLISNTAFNVMIPKVAGRNNLINAHTNLEAADAIATLVGPVLGGVLFAKMGASFTLLFSGVLSVLSLVFIYLVKYEEKISVKESTSNTVKGKVDDFISKSAEGFRYLFANYTQIISTISICVLGFSTVFIPLLVVIHANTTLNLSAEYIGIILSFAGVGNIIGIILLKYLKNPNWMPLLSLLLLVSALGITIILFTGNFWLICLGMLLFDGALSMAFVVQAAVHQGVTPDEVLSRIRSATYVLSGIFAMLGSFLSGAIPQYTSTSIGFGLGIIMLVSVAIYILKYKIHSVQMSEIKPIYIHNKGS